MYDRPTVRLVVWCAAALSLAGVAHGDGAFFKRTATEAPPPIPRQQALISFRDGVETLLIESTVENDGSELAWVIPVPARPTRYEAVDPGILETLRMNTATRVRNEWNKGLAIGAASTVVLVAILSFLIVPRGYFGYRRPWWLLLLVPCWALLNFFLVGSMPRGSEQLRVAAGASEPAVTELEGLLVGNYFVKLLDVHESEGLLRWLHDEGFGELPQHAREVVDAYVDEGWLFVAARLGDNLEGEVRPHPIALEFPVETPVYPMRLTQVAGTDTYVELYIVADAQAKPSARALELHWSDLVEEGAFPEYLCKPTPHDADSTATVSEFAFKGALYHPMASRFFWDGAVVTRLAGTFTPAAMAKDVYIGFHDFARFRRQAISKEVAAARLGFGGVMGLACIAIVADCLYWIGRKRHARRYLLMVPLPAVVGALGAVAVVWLTLPPIAPYVDTTPGKGMQHIPPDFLTLCALLDDREPDIWSDPERLRTRVREYVAHNRFTNRDQGGVIQESYSPGNYTVEWTECGAQIWEYSFWHVSQYPSPGDLQRFREARDETFEWQYMPRAVQCLVPPAMQAEWQSTASIWMQKFRFAEIDTGFVFRFNANEYTCEEIVEAWKRVGTLQELPSDEWPRVFITKLYAEDPETGESTALAWWDDRMRIRDYRVDENGEVIPSEFFSFGSPLACVRWPGGGEYPAPADVTAMAYADNHKRITVYVYARFGT